MTTRELLLKAHKLISDPARWCTGAYARNAEKIPVREIAAEATQWCAVGALARYLGEGGRVQPALDLLQECAEHTYGDRCLTIINDHRGHDAILRVFELAIMKAAAQEAEKKAAQKAKKALEPDAD